MIVPALSLCEHQRAQVARGTPDSVSSVSLTLSYNNTAHVHAETNAGSNSYAYAADGNPSATLRAGMTSRTVAGGTFTLGYDAEGRMVSASGPSLTASFGFCPQGESLRA